MNTWESEKIPNNSTNYKLRDQNIKEILDIFNWNDESWYNIAHKQIDFFEQLLKDINQKHQQISINTPPIEVSYSQSKNWELTKILFKPWNDILIDVNNLTRAAWTKIYNMTQAWKIIWERWSIIQEDMEQWWACYDKPTNSIFVNQKILDSNLLLCALLHEIGHANDVNFIINNIDMSNLELINNKQWIEIISNHSKVERYAHAYMLNKLRQYQDLPVIDEYIKSCKQVINYTLMIYKYWYLNNIIWLWIKWLLSSEEYIKLYKKN